MLDRYEDPVFKLDLEQVPAYRFVIAAGAVYEELKQLQDERKIRFDKDIQEKFKILAKIAQGVIASIKEHEEKREPCHVKDFYIEDYKAAKSKLNRIKQRDYLRDRIKKERADLEVEQKQLEKDISDTAELVAALEDRMRHKVNAKKDRIQSELVSLEQDLKDAEQELQQPEGGDDVLVGCFPSLEQRREQRRQQRLDARINEISVERSALKAEQEQLGLDDDERKEQILNRLAELKKQKLLLQKEKDSPPRRVGLFSAVFPNLSHNAAVNRQANLERNLEVSRERVADLNQKMKDLAGADDQELNKNERILRMFEDRKIEIDAVLNQPFDDHALQRRMEQEEFKQTIAVALRERDIDKQVDWHYGKYKPYFMFQMLGLYILIVDCVQSLDSVSRNLERKVETMHEAAKLIHCDYLNRRDLFTLHAKADAHKEDKIKFLYTAFAEEFKDEKEFTDTEKSIRANYFLKVFSVRNVNEHAALALFRPAVPVPETLSRDSKGKEEEEQSQESSPAFGLG